MICQQKHGSLLVPPWVLGMSRVCSHHSQCNLAMRYLYEGLGRLVNRNIIPNSDNSEVLLSAFIILIVVYTFTTLKTQTICKAKVDSTWRMIRESSSGFLVKNLQCTRRTYSYCRLGKLWDASSSSPSCHAKVLVEWVDFYQQTTNKMNKTKTQIFNL